MSQTGISSVWTTPLEQEPSERRDEDETRRSDDIHLVHDSADHVRAHVLSALVGPSVSVPVQGGRLTLGQFQRIVLLEFEGPRERAIELASSAPSG